jgi:hypothetical protein
VTELLHGVDDRLVIFGPGDEVTVRFDARGLPPLPDGWERSFVLRTWGWSKDASPFTLTGGSVEPLPFRSMTSYPDGAQDPKQAGARDDEDRKRWHTRGGKDENR